MSLKLDLQLFAEGDGEGGAAGGTGKAESSGSADGALFCKCFT